MLNLDTWPALTNVRIPRRTSYSPFQDENRGLATPLVTHSVGVSPVGPSSSRSLELNLAAGPHLVATLNVPYLGLIRVDRSLVTTRLVSLPPSKRYSLHNIPFVNLAPISTAGDPLLVAFPYPIRNPVALARWLPLVWVAGGGLASSP
ncbi:hypothetical protein V5O48_006730 [Marasmius crinis-equi]|uniref:Uncharacterized protein n=1 Tax=Marasmius crinis-equi TaxID=585013 RepID=A0ABR3FIP8_9AGAR